MATKKPFFAFKDISLLYHPLSLFVFCLLVIGVFFATNPKFSPMVFPFKRAKMITSFIESSRKQGKINPQEFWALREFYAPGTLTVNKTATSAPFLVFKSGKVESYEWLTSHSGPNAKKLPAGLLSGQIDFNSGTELIYHDNRSLHVVFLKPISEMVKADSVYDYKDKDKQFLKDKLWFAETTFQTQ